MYFVQLVLLPKPQNPQIIDLYLQNSRVLIFIYLVSINIKKLKKSIIWSFLI